MTASEANVSCGLSALATTCRRARARNIGGRGCSGEKATPSSELGRSHVPRRYSDLVGVKWEKITSARAVEVTGCNKTGGTSEPSISPKCSRWYLRAKRARSLLSGANAKWRNKPVIATHKNSTGPKPPLRTSGIRLTLRRPSHLVNKAGIVFSRISNGRAIRRGVWLVRFWRPSLRLRILRAFTRTAGLRQCLGCAVRRLREIRFNLAQKGDRRRLARFHILGL